MQIEISLEFLSELIGVKKGDLSAAVKKDDENLKETAEIEKVIKDNLKTKIEAVRKEARDEGHGRGKRESLTQIEKDLASKHKVSDEGGIDAVIARVLDKHKTEGSELTPEAIKQSDIYINDLKKEIEKRKTLQTEFESFKTDVETTSKRSRVAQEVQKILPERKFALPQSERVRDRLINAYVDEILEQSDISIVDGKIVAKDKKGQPHRDDMMNELSFADYASTLAADFFEVKAGDGRESPGATTPPTGGGGKLPSIKSKDDFYTAYYAADSVESKKELKAHYDKLVEAGEIDN